nr:MAG TPA: hypothetical protein [Caudoviricetes sp.]
MINCQQKIFLNFLIFFVDKIFKLCYYNIVDRTSANNKEIK